MNELKSSYHKFLNTAIARTVEPCDLCDGLRERKTLEDWEAELIKNEPTMPLRQFCLFLKILPTKGEPTRHIVSSVLRQCGYETAAEEWFRCTGTSIEKRLWDGVSVSNTDRLLPQIRALVGPPEQTNLLLTAASATVLTPQGDFTDGVRVVVPTAAVQYYQAAAPRRIAVPEPETRAPEPCYLPSAAPPLPPPPPPGVSRFLRTNFAQRVVEPTVSDSVQPPPPPPPPLQAYGQAPPPPPAAIHAYGQATYEPQTFSTDSLYEVDQVEEVSRVVYSGGLQGPPSSRSVGSAGVSARTPDSFFESQPRFAPHVDHLEKAPSAARGSLNASEIQLGQIIGRGSFAQVYVAQFAGRKVAVKKFRDYDEFSLAMFVEEINIMKDLNHRNVIKFVGFVHSPEDRQLWLLTEFVAGGAMRRFCTPEGRKTQLDKSLPLKDKVRIAIDCWQGLDYIHGLNLCHKDISPGNVLISNDLTQVKISDFGLAEFKNLVMTAVTQVSGTPMYYPPEFASESGVIRHPRKSDIYSMGASLCELFSEQWFWNINGQARTPFQVMFMLSEHRRLWVDSHLAKEPDCWPQIPSVVQPMLKQAIAPDHKERKTARELCMASQDLLKLVK